jgi:hypothetical protein
MELRSNGCGVGLRDGKLQLMRLRFAPTEDPFFIDPGSAQPQ